MRSRFIVALVVASCSTVLTVGLTAPLSAQQEPGEPWSGVDGPGQRRLGRDGGQRQAKSHMRGNEVGRRQVGRGGERVREHHRRHSNEADAIRGRVTVVDVARQARLVVDVAVEGAGGDTGYGAGNAPLVCH